MRCYCRATDQRFNTTQTWRENRQRQPFHESVCSFDVAFQFETQHAAETIEELSSARVSRVILKTAIVNRFYCRMLLQKLRNAKSAVVLKPYS